MEKPQPVSLDDYLKLVDYTEDENYVPSEFALEFLAFIRLVHADMPTENKTPVAHLRYLDKIIAAEGDVINLCHRGFAKSTIKEYLILYLAVYGGVFPGFGRTRFVLYISDTIDNGVKKMKEGLKYKCENSGFLNEYLDYNLTIDRWAFKNVDGEQFIVGGYGAATGVRGTRELGERPGIALMDDLMSDEVANSPASLKKLEEVVNGAIEYALHPTKRKIIWSGTPFNSKDAIVKGVESGSYDVNVFPVCEKFPCEPEEFKGSWEDRFPYSAVLRAYTKAKNNGSIANFNREMMLRIMSDDDRLVSDNDIKWYSFAAFTKNKGMFNYYITTDFATSERQASDFSVISVWAINSSGHWFWVDGICERQLMDANINDLFRLCQKWCPQQVGIEVSGQQGGFIQWIEAEMMSRNIFFSLASENNNGKAGIRPNTNKLERFNIVVPWFKKGEIHFPKEKQHLPIMKQAMDELSLVSPSGFRSKHDDFSDTISMLAKLQVWKPSAALPSEEDYERDVWDNYSEDETLGIDSYLT